MKDLLTVANRGVDTEIGRGTRALRIPKAGSLEHRLRDPSIHGDPHELRLISGPIGLGAHNIENGALIGGHARRVKIVRDADQ
jgi:hypothetical protein